MQTNLAVQYDEGNTAFQDALLRLGDRWPVAATEDFSTSFVTQITSVYGHLLASWPDGAGPEESLALLSADIAGQLRPTAERFGIDTFGLSLSSRTHVVDESLPFLLLYDLERGLRVPMTETEKLFMPERALWVGYAPLDEEEIEKFLTLQQNQALEPPSEKVLANLQVWQKGFSHSLAAAQADALLSMEAQTSLLGLLKQGRLFQGAIILAQGKTATVKNKTDVKAETQKMRTALIKQLSNGALPEAVRAALRLSLKQLDKAAGEKPVAWIPARAEKQHPVLKSVGKEPIKAEQKTGPQKSVANSPSAPKATLSAAPLVKADKSVKLATTAKTTINKAAPLSKVLPTSKQDQGVAKPQQNPTLSQRTVRIAPSVENPQSVVAHKGISSVQRGSPETGKKSISITVTKETKLSSKTSGVPVPEARSTVLLKQTTIVPDTVG